MDSVTFYGAKSNLAQLVERGAAGEKIIIAKAGRPLAHSSWVTIKAGCYDTAGKPGVDQFG